MLADLINFHRSLEV